ncbi:E3 ubiquitin ligase PARAQUAT TOLERANCE 3-like [Phalaenopsis equestris]|uniref:E3 ubiquitin ligase PARAQUAT TOLERANCE 3-like n=1 Tax=Phalaenopsis equestris TaxID=78828 RepID=UPI0009E30ED9|nr:E3 ubiquitin ligase PARAQUAT TOLERANCE 3-like [Phalaenopsis equestris]
MAVYYKFKSAKDYDSISIEGQFISVSNLKERIFESKHLGRGTDFDLMVSNAQTDEEYVDEAAMIPKNTSVLIRRVPGRPRIPIVTERDEPTIVEDKIEHTLPSNSLMLGDSSTVKYPDESEWDEFGNDLYSVPDVHPPQSSAALFDVSPVNKVDEESKIKALVDTPALDWNRQGHDSYGAGRGFGRGMGGRMMAGRGFGRGILEKKTPPTGYICHRCKVPGHFIQHCPTNGDPNYDIKRVKPPTGIPRSMLMATPDGSYALPSGAVAVLKPNEAAFEKEIEGLPSTRSISDLPPELRCPLCKEVMKDAVLTSKCCFKSFCDKCIRDYIITNSKCVCGATNILADDLLPNKTLRETISRILETTTSSTENAGSLVQVQDMESARHVQPRVPSPTLSATTKDEPRQPPLLDQTAYSKEVEGASELKADNVAPNIVDKKSEKTMDQAEATPDSTNAKEIAYTEAIPIPEEAQEKVLLGDQGKKKKKKKTRIATMGGDMQWRGFQDFGMENFTGMPMGPSAYNPYWGNGMPIGMDGFMPHLAASMPYMGYAPTPFDVPFGGILPHDPYAAQGYMMPGFPQRDLAELGMNGFAMNQGPPLMSREGYEARKAEMRRKREMDRAERLGERYDVGGRREKMALGKESNSNVEAAPLLKKKAKPRLRSEAASIDRLDRDDRPEKQTNMDHMDREEKIVRKRARRRAVGRRRCSFQAGAEAEGQRVLSNQLSGGGRQADRGGAGKRKKTSPEPPNGLKDQHERERDRPIANGYPSSSAGRRSGGGGYEHESSDEERHFKRRSSARRESEEEEAAARGPLNSRGVSRERDHRVNDVKRR